MRGTVIASKIEEIKAFLDCYEAARGVGDPWRVWHLEQAGKVIQQAADLDLGRLSVARPEPQRKRRGKGSTLTGLG